MADSEWKFDEDESEDGKVYFVLLNDPAMPRLLSKIWVFQQKFYQLTNLPAATSYKEEENSSLFRREIKEYKYVYINSWIHFHRIITSQQSQSHISPNNGLYIILYKIIIDYRVFFNWYAPKKLKYVKPRLGESTLT